MFTRSRSGPNQNFGGRSNNMMNTQNNFPTGNNAYNQQGNYTPNNAYKPSGPIGQQVVQQQQPLQQQQHPQQQQQQQQQVHPNQQSQQAPPAIIPPPRLKPILKAAAVPPANVPTAPPVTTPIEVDPPTIDKDESTIDSADALPRWKRNKVAGVKVNRKLKRLRMNQRLRKTLMPKNAIMVLNEMKAGVQFTFPENQSVPNSLFMVHAELDGKTYVGQGLSKPLARQNAAENALKSLLLEKMTAAALKAKVEEELESSQNKADSETDGSQMETNNGDEPEEIPWSSLASFALYKLFLEWQNQGTVVPIPRPGVQQSVKPKSEPKAPVEKKLPNNPETVHPVMLLNQMRPGTTYLEVCRVGNPPNTLFTLSVEVDGQVFTGEAKNKKDAKKMAAKAALEVLYGVHYPADMVEDPKNQSMEGIQTQQG